MNIKGLLGANVMTPLEPTKKVERKGVQSDSSHERDANGQQHSGEQKKHGPMSDEQIKKAIEHLKALPAVKEHKWTVELAVENDKKYILIKDNLSNVIRRIPELDLWTLPLFEEAPKGNLLKKTA